VLVRSTTPVFFTTCNSPILKSARPWGFEPKPSDPWE
jgi:hypothetical protein